MTEDLIIGGYRRVSIMQVGQNSEVWEVADVTTGQRFAMKLLLPEKITDPEHRRMLKHEATIGMKLKHPKIIKFFGIKRDGDTQFILMEYFPSLNLKLRLLRQGQYESFIRPRLRNLLEQLASAIGYMNDLKWVHRDIKPDNVLINSQGDVRLIDFALCKRAGRSFLQFFGHSRRTAGTRSYMSPEQIRGQALDGRADLYSLGIMTFEIVAGKLPFVAPSGNDLLRKHLFDDVPLIDAARKVTPEFTELLTAMLAKKIKDRPANMNEFLSRFRQIRIFTDEVMQESPSSHSMMG